MKKILKTAIITIVLLAIITGGAIFLLKGSGEKTNEFVSHRRHEQSDQDENRAYRFETDSLATELVRSGDNKNVLNFDSNQPFSVVTSDSARERLDRLIRRMDPTFENPIIAYNPFGTMPNTYYFYFKTPSKCMVKYTVTVEDEKINDHIRYVNNGEVKNLTQEHEFVIGGLIPGMRNYIIIELVDENGSQREYATYKVDVPAADMPSQITYERGKSDLQLQNGLFFMMPIDDRQIYAYDNNGILRGIVATDTSHGRRLFQTESRLVYQVSDKRVVRVDRIGRVDGVALFDDGGRILDIAYDGYENVFALMKSGKGRYYLARSSMKGGASKKIFSFDKGITPTSISSVSGGNLYVSAGKPAGLIRIDGLMSESPRAGLVIGLKKDWKKTSLKKRVSDPTKTEKPKTDEEGKDKDKEATESAETEAATGQAAEKEDIKDPPLLGWDMTDTILDLVTDESDGKTDTLTFGVVKDRLVHAIKLQINRKEKKATILLDKEIEFAGQVDVQWGERESCVVANLSRGKYEERDEDFKVTREFSYDRAMDGVWKRSLEGMCFYA